MGRAFGGTAMITAKRLKDLLDRCPADAIFYAFDEPAEPSGECGVTIFPPTGGTR